MVSYRALDCAKISCFVGSINSTTQILAHWTVVGTNFRPEIVFSSQLISLGPKCSVLVLFFPQCSGLLGGTNPKKKRQKREKQVTKWAESKTKQGPKKTRGRITGGEVPANSAAAAAVGEDPLSGLPNDIRVLILVRLGRAAAAAAVAGGRTSVLSPPLAPPLALVPELRFPVTRPPRLIGSALAAHDAPLRHLRVETVGAAPESVAAWLPVAAYRLSGDLLTAKWCFEAGRWVVLQSSRGTPSTCVYVGESHFLSCLEFINTSMFYLGTCLRTGNKHRLRCHM